LCETRVVALLRALVFVVAVTLVRVLLSGLDFSLHRRSSLRVLSSFLRVAVYRLTADASWTTKSIKEAEINMALLIYIATNFHPPTLIRHAAIFSFKL
jgi:hypothetical protein